MRGGGGTVCESRNTLMLSENMPAEGISQNQVPKDHRLFRCHPRAQRSAVFSVGTRGIAVTPRCPPPLFLQRV